MTPIDDTHYTAAPGEVIAVSTHVDKLPFLVGFSDPPDNATWQNVVPDGTGEQRSFTMPAAGDPANVVRYVAAYSESIAPGDPDPTQTYTIVISGSAGGTRTSYVVVGEGTLPIQLAYYFATSA